MPDITEAQIEEIIAAARELEPYLSTSTDPDNSSLQDRTERAADYLKKSQPQRMREEADTLEAKEAAIWRLRRALC